jgi:hypothetical protein
VLLALSTTAAAVAAFSLFSAWHDLPDLAGIKTIGRMDQATTVYDRHDRYAFAIARERRFEVPLAADCMVETWAWQTGYRVGYWRLSVAGIPAAASQICRLEFDPDARLFGLHDPERWFTGVVCTRLVFDWWVRGRKIKTLNIG